MDFDSAVSSWKERSMRQIAVAIASHTPKCGRYFIRYDLAQCSTLVACTAACPQVLSHKCFRAGLREARYHPVRSVPSLRLMQQVAVPIAGILLRSPGGQ